MKTLKTLALIALAFVLSACAQQQGPFKTVDTVIGTVGDSFGNVSGRKNQQ